MTKVVWQSGAAMRIRLIFLIQMLVSIFVRADLKKKNFFFRVGDSEGHCTRRPEISLNLSDNYLVTHRDPTETDNHLHSN